MLISVRGEQKYDWDDHITDALQFKWVSWGVYSQQNNNNNNAKQHRAYE